MILPSLVRFEYSLISVMGITMRQNMAKGPKSVSVTVSRVIGSLLRAVVPKRNSSNDIEHGIVSFGLHPLLLAM